MADATTALESLRVNFLKTAEEARKSREIGFFDYRRCVHLTTPRVWNRVDKDVNMTYGAEVQEMLVSEGISEGVFAPGVDVTTIDWEKLIAFIKELIPLIMQLIALFGV